MSSSNLAKLARIGKLKQEPFDQAELNGLIKSGRARWRELAVGHQRRNVAEYEGHLDVEEQLVADIIAVAEDVFEKLIDIGKKS